MLYFETFDKYDSNILTRKSSCVSYIQLKLKTTLLSSLNSGSISELLLGIHVTRTRCKRITSAPPRPPPSITITPTTHSTNSSSVCDSSPRPEPPFGRSTGNLKSKQSSLLT